MILLTAGWIDQAFGAAGRKLAHVEMQERIDAQRAVNAKFQALKEFGRTYDTREAHER